MRAAVADLTSIKNRGFAYGIFNTVYGLALFFGSVAVGFLYEISLAYLIFFVALIEIISMLLIFFSTKESK
jgi:MFS family permease